MHSVNESRSQLIATVIMGVVALLLCLTLGVILSFGGGTRTAANLEAPRVPTVRTGESITSAAPETPEAPSRRPPAAMQQVGPSPSPVTPTEDERTVAPPDPPMPPAKSTVPAEVVLPGRFEAEDYKAGGAGRGYHDRTQGNSGGAYRSDDVDIEPCLDGAGCYNVGWVAPGEWLAYDVTFARSGIYTFTIRVAAPGGDARFHIEVDGVNVTGPMRVPRTGDHAVWTDVVRGSIFVLAGHYELRLVAESDGFNWNYVVVTNRTTPPVSLTEAPPVLPPGAAQQGGASPPRLVAPRVVRPSSADASSLPRAETPGATSSPRQSPPALATPVPTSRPVPRLITSTVITSGANVRSAPAMGDNIIGSVRQGDELIVLGVLGDWYLVRLGEQVAAGSTIRGGQGWVGRAVVKEPPRSPPRVTPTRGP